MNFSEKLKNLRKDEAVTQEELTKSIFVSRTLITKYESGTVYPTKDNVEKLALYFNVPISYLIDEADTVQPVLKQNEASNKINFVFTIIIIIVAAIIALMSLVPPVQSSFPDYSQGIPPQVVTTYNSPIMLTVINGNPIAIITLITSVANAIISKLTTRFKNNVWLKLVNYVLFVINIFLIIFSMLFAISYSSNNLYSFFVPFP